jgi:hypothetical protein
MPVTVKRRVSRAQAQKIIKTWGLTVSPRELARLGVWGESTIYDMLREGRFPVEPIKVGNRWRIPTAAVLKRLELED